MGDGASSALGPPRPPPRGRGGLLRPYGRWSQPGLRPSDVVGSWSSTVPIHAYSSSGAIPVGKAPGESVSCSADGHLRQECCAAGGGGGSGYRPSPRDLPAKRCQVGSTWRANGPHP